MSLFQFCRYKAMFVDDNGDFVGSKVFYRSTGGIGQKKKFFHKGNRTYNIKAGKASRLFNVNFFDLFFDDYIYIYNINNPDPISLKCGVAKPIMNPEDYFLRLNSNLVKDLQNAAKKGIDFKEMLPYIIGGLVIFGILYFFLTGGTFSGLPVDSVDSSVVTGLVGGNN